jgi:hypothetical protein
MGTFSKGIVAFAVVYFGLVLVKDGTLPRLVTDAAKGTNDLIGGLKPITGLA